MAVTADANFGFAGSITTVQWARVARLLGFRYAVEDVTALVPSVVSGTRALDISAGAAWGSGVLSVHNSVTRLTFPTPTAGQWFAVVERRVWASKAATLIVLDGPTTSTTQPAEPPSALPGTAVTNPGVQDDQILFWAWASNLTSTVVIFDMRLVPGISELVAITAAGRFGVASPQRGDGIVASDTGQRYVYTGTGWQTGALTDTIQNVIIDGPGFSIATEGAVVARRGRMATVNLHVNRDRGDRTGRIGRLSDAALWPTRSHWGVLESSGIVQGECRVQTNGEIHWVGSPGNATGAVVTITYPLV